MLSTGTITTTFVALYEYTVDPDKITDINVYYHMIYYQLLFTTAIGDWSMQTID